LSEKVLRLPNNWIFTDHAFTFRLRPWYVKLFLNNRRSQYAASIFDGPTPAVESATERLDCLGRFLNTSLH
jgi:hypothetical protein